ncbi:MAG: cytochrome C oxidase subunit IV family protein [Flavobacteriaceae bacterium]
MKNTFLTTWAFLVFFTLMTVFVVDIPFQYTAVPILGLAFLKCIGVAFYFMELKKANLFWKVSLVLFLLVFIAVVLMV